MACEEGQRGILGRLDEQARKIDVMRLSSGELVELQKSRKFLFSMSKHH